MIDETPPPSIGCAAPRRLVVVKTARRDEQRNDAKQLLPAPFEIEGINLKKLAGRILPSQMPA